ncbi:MAG: Gfo/Idh/MocA family protein [Brevundimonas sp.]
MSTDPIRLGLVGVGVIARSQHLPAIAASSRLDLIGAASRHAGVDGVPCRSSLAELLDAVPEIQAVSLCTPPAPRFADARLALKAGRHVMLEKPPGATLAEVRALADQAEKAGLTLFATWHSRHAAGVEPARAWLADKTIRRVHIEWREDVRVWHPGQDWIFEPGGLGVFDPGVNALSIATRILPVAFLLRTARLHFPENRQTPILADLAFETVDGAPVTAVFDFLQTGDQTWSIRVETDGAVLNLTNGGADLFIDEVQQPGPAHDGVLGGEYARLYDRFVDLIAAGQSDVDLTPLSHVADAFMLGERISVPAFHF